MPLKHASQQSVWAAVLALASLVPAIAPAAPPAATWAELEGQRITAPLPAQSSVKNALLLLIHDKDGKDKLVIRLDQGAGGQSLEAELGRAGAGPASGEGRSAYFELPPCFELQGFQLKEAVGPNTALPENVPATLFYRDAQGRRQAIGDLRTTPGAQDPYSRPWIKLWFGADIRSTPWDAVLYLDLKVLGNSPFSGSAAASRPVALESHVQGGLPQPRPAVLREPGLLVLECKRPGAPLEKLLKEQYILVQRPQAGQPATVRIVAQAAATEWSMSGSWVPHREKTDNAPILHEPPAGFEVGGSRGQSLYFVDTNGQKILVGELQSASGDSRVAVGFATKLAVTRWAAKILLQAPAGTGSSSGRAPSSGAGFDDLRNGRSH